MVIRHSAHDTRGWQSVMHVLCTGYITCMLLGPELWTASKYVPGLLSVVSCYTDRCILPGNGTAITTASVEHDPI